MPSIKRWFHLSQEINRDPEFREYVKKFGLGGLRFWLEALATLDRTDNFWDLHRGFDLGLLAASCQTKAGIIRGSYEHLVNINWLRVGVDQDMKLFIYAPNWAKYNKKREDKGSMKDSLREDEKLHPIPSPIPSPNPKKEEKSSAILDKPKRPTRQSFEEWWQKEILTSPAYSGVDLQRELEKMKVWLTLPKAKGRKLTMKFALAWLNKIDPGESVNGHGSSTGSKGCWKRIPDGDSLRPCKATVVGLVNGNPFCAEHTIPTTSGVLT
ncbi:hypothetical protein ACTRXD_16915 [Nitrospira sp. T9]|uniref:hypothetical protein n=1 Tax=unclassified Nitrospira TaxID=2652172 RepID=UPI003F9C7852